MLCVDPEGEVMSYSGESFADVRGFDLSDAPDDTRITAGELQIGVTYREQYLLVGYDGTGAPVTVGGRAGRCLGALWLGRAVRAA